MEYGYCNICKNKITDPNNYKFHRGKKICISCYEKNVEAPKQNNQQREHLEQYICKLFDFDEIPINYKQQIDKFIKDYKLTLKGIEGSLYYFYEILDNSIENDVCMGIVPRIYEESKSYFKEKSEIAKINQNFTRKDEKIVVKIKKPDGRIPTKSRIEDWD